MAHEWPLTLRDRDLVLRPLRRRDRKAFDALWRENRSWLLPWDATDPTRRPAAPGFPTVLRVVHRQGREGSAVPLMITRHGRLLGQITADPVMYGAQSTAVLGYWVDEEHAGNGLVPRAAALIIDHLFAELGVHRVEVNVRPENRSSLRVAEKLHLRQEGLRRGYIHVDGAFRDHLCFALTAEEVTTDHTGRGVLARYVREFEGDSGAL